LWSLPVVVAHIEVENAFLPIRIATYVTVLIVGHNVVVLTVVSNTLLADHVINVLWVLTVMNRTAATTCQARPDIEIRHDPTTQILAISLKERFV